MSTDVLAAVESSGTTDALTDDKRVLDLGDVEPASVPGATVIFATAYARTDGGAPVDEPGTCAQCGREGVESYVCEPCAEANNDRRDDDVSGSEPADFGGGPSGVDEL